MSLRNITNISQINLITYDSFGNKMDNKIWGPLNNKSTMTYEIVDTVFRTLNGLSKNTYDDTVLTADENYNVNSTTNPTYSSEVEKTYFTVQWMKVQKVLEKQQYKIWDALSPEKRVDLLTQIFGNGSRDSEENQLFYLVNKDTFTPQTTITDTGVTKTYFASGLAKISVNEKILEEG